MRNDWPTVRRRATPICTSAPTVRTNGRCSLRSTQARAGGQSSQLQAAARDPLHADLVTLLKIRPDSINLLRVAQSNAATVVTERSPTLTAAAQDEERNWMAVTIGSVLLAIALLWLTNRWITRPLRSLADQAVTMAGRGCPARCSRSSTTPVGEEIVPARGRTGQRARRRRSARRRGRAEPRAGQARSSSPSSRRRLRRNVADAFVNLGRRNQNLLSRQLEFITQLENDESDPETLEHLFRLDHLATRMRRNAESLLVLAGPSRRARGAHPSTSATSYAARWAKSRAISASGCVTSTTRTRRRRGRGRRRAT